VIFRFTRSLASLAILIAVYWLYALIVVPIIEPAARGRPEEVDNPRGPRRRAQPPAARA